MTRTRNPRQSDVRSEYPLDDDHSLLFVTRRTETVCICEAIRYDKLIARHIDAKDLERQHEDLKPLFQQYIDDAKRNLKQCLNSTPRSIG